MPSRRIASTPNLAPVQVLSVNPFNSFTSGSVNKLTRIVSGGKDVIVSGLDVLPTKINQTYISQNIFPETNQGWVLTNCKTHVTESGRWDGFFAELDHNTPYGASSIEYTLPENNEFAYLYGNNVTRQFKIETSINAGNPQAIIVHINNDSTKIDYPRQTGSVFQCLVNHNFRHDNSIKIKIEIIFSLTDTNCSYPIDSNKSIVWLGIPTASVIYNGFEDGDYVARSTIDNEYSFVNIHPRTSLDIMPGVLIKDDVMLNLTGKDELNNRPILTLRINDSKCWINGDKYKENDFIGSQKVYFLNGSNISKDWTFSNGKLVGTVNSETISLVDEKQLTDADIKLSLNYEYGLDNNIKFTIEPTIISDSPDEKQEMQGKIVLWCYNNGEEKIVFKQSDIDLELISGEVRTIEKEIYIDKSEFPEEITSDNISNVECYLTAGPIKVSGSNTEFNPEKIKYAYIVAYYSYFVNPEPNVCYIGLIKPEYLEDATFREDYVILAKIRIVDIDTFDVIDYTERQQNYLDPDLINATDVNYSNTIPLNANGWSPRNYWENDEGEVIVPDTVSNALTELAKRFDVNRKLQKTFAKIPRSSVSTNENVIISFGPESNDNRLSIATRSDNSTRLTVNYLNNKLDKIPEETTNNSLAFYSDNEGTLSSSDDERLNKNSVIDSVTISATNKYYTNPSSGHESANNHLVIYSSNNDQSGERIEILKSSDLTVYDINNNIELTQNLKDSIECLPISNDTHEIDQVTYSYNTKVKEAVVEHNGLINSYHYNVISGEIRYPDAEEVKPKPYVQLDENNGYVPLNITQEYQLPDDGILTATCTCISSSVVSFEILNVSGEPFATFKLSPPTSQDNIHILNVSYRLKKDMKVRFLSSLTPFKEEQLDNCFLQYTLIKIKSQD